MKNKKILASIASVCLVAALGVGATLAYYTSETDTAVNTFTVGNVKIDLVEPEWQPENGQDLLPGAEVSKNPKIVNVGKSDGYMMLQVTGADAMADYFTIMNGEDEGYNYADWTYVDAEGNVLDNDEHVLKDGYYVYKEAVASKDATSALFTSVVFNEDAAEIQAETYTIVANYKDEKTGDLFTYDDETTTLVPELDSNGVPVIVYTIKGVDDTTFDTYEDAEAYVEENFRTDASFLFDLSLKGYAIQADEIEYVEDDVYTWVGELTGEAPLLDDADASVE